ncbi:MAG: hypothetical protein ASARMPRED_009438, partial [Alectoria sarmentosa]
LFHCVACASQHTADVNLAADPELKAAKSLTDGKGPDVVVDTTGSLALMNAALLCLAPRGRLAHILAPRKGSTDFTFDVEQVYREEKAIIGCNSVLAELPETAIELKAMTAGFENGSLRAANEAELETIGIENAVDTPHVVRGGDDVASAVTADDKATPKVTTNVSVGEKENMDHSILDPEKARYFDASSAIAFPRLLGIQFGANKAPRLHSFAWNLGIRSEPVPNTLDITQFTSLDDVLIYSNDYFVVVHPAFDFLDQQEFIRRTSLRWKNIPTEEALNFDAVICGVVALGYFVSQKTDNGIEATLTSFAKERLESITLAKPPTVDLIAAWILRTIYLRATSRPHASWMASNIMMHLIEASGIQRDLSSIALVYPSSISTNVDQAKSVYRRKVFWIGRAINAMFSYEYSRPRIIINRISCARVDNLVSGATRGYLQMAELIPDNSQTCDESSDITQTKSMIESLARLTASEVPLSLFCADLAFAAYRHLRAMRNAVTCTTSTAEPTIVHLLSIGSGALKAIHDHLPKSSPPSPHSEDAPSVTPWWSLISIPFHFILILLSLDTPESISQVSRALQTLQAVAAVFNTHLTREAVQNATMLIRLSLNRKERDVKALRDVLSEVSRCNEDGLTGSRQSGRDAVVEPEGIEIDRLNSSRAGQQQQAGNQLSEDLGLEWDLGGLGTGNSDGLINPNIAVDWDALFENPDLLDWM